MVTQMKAECVCGVSPWTVTVEEDGMSKHLGTIFRSIDSAHSCGWDLLVLSKDDLDFSGTSDLPACGRGKEIELVWIKWTGME